MELNTQEPKPAEPRLIRRVVVLEEPEIFTLVQQRAREQGHSVAAEYRGAVRRLLRTEDE
jgi:hypothetical protein